MTTNSLPTPRTRKTPSLLGTQLAVILVAGALVAVMLLLPSLPVR